MARTRNLIIGESLAALRRREARVADAAARRRLSAIRMLKESPDLTMRALSEQLDVPERTVNRWLSLYRRDGIDALEAVGRYAPRIPDEILQDLRDRCVLGEFATTSAVRSWLLATHGISISLPAVVALLDRHLGGRSRKGLQAPPDKAVRVTDPADGAGTRVTEWLHDHLIRLPERPSVLEWIESFRTSLAAMLEVDRVSVDLNIHAMKLKSTAPRSKSAKHDISIAECKEGGTAGRARVSVDRIATADSRQQGIIARMVEAGLDLALFHEPFVDLYYMAEGTYLGAVVLWQARDRRPISDGVRSILISMRPLIVRLMIDCAARHESQSPGTRHFYDALGRMVAEAGLTRSEERAATLRLLGHSYKEIAERMHTTVDNVSKHMTSVHRKTGTSSITDLSARLFAPRVR